jgi:phospholipase/carboxylesterase
MRDTLLCCIILCLAAATLSGQSAPNRWIDHSKVPLYDSHAGDFLDQNSAALLLEAQQAYNKKDYEGAARRYLYILQFERSNSTVIYNLACCYALLNKPQLATLYLQRALTAGFNDHQLLAQDTDFNTIRGYAEFDSVLIRAKMLAQNSGEEIYLQAEKMIKCRVRLPDHFNPQKKYPLLIGMHGYGGNADDFVRIYRHFIDREVIFACPEAPYHFTQNNQGRGSHFSWAVQIQDSKVWEKADPLSLTYVADVARQLRKQFKVGDVYLLGFSQGAAYAYMSAFRHPDLFRGLICFGGAFPEKSFSYAGITEEDIDKAKDLRVFIAHGIYDQAISFQESENAQKRLSAKGYNVQLIHFKGEHELPPDALNKALEWMRQK